MGKALETLAVLRGLSFLSENNGEPLIEPVTEEDPEVGEDNTGDDGGEGGIGENGDMQAALQDKAKKDEDDDEGQSAGAGSLEALTEGKHFNTRIKMLEASHHPTKVRLALKEAHRMIENILNPSHPSPNPSDDDSRKIFESCSRKLGGMMESMKQATVRRRMPK